MSRDQAKSHVVVASAGLDNRILAARQKRAGKGKAAGVEPWRLRDIRQTVVMRMIDIGILRDVVEAVMNHISGHRAGVAGVYNRAAYAAEKRQNGAVSPRRIMPRSG